MAENANDRFNPLNNGEVARGMDARAPRRPAEDWTPPDSEFDEFIDQLSGLEPETDETPIVPVADETPPVAAQPTPAAPVAPAAVPPPSPSPVAPPAESPPVARFAYNGQYYTAEELAQSGLLAEALQRATQPSAPQAPPPDTTAQPSPAQQYQPPSAQDVQRYYAPVVQEMVRQGHVEEDLAALYPAAVSGMFQMRDMILNMARKVVEQDQYLQMLRQREMHDTTVNSLYSAMDTAAEADPIYAAMKNQDERRQFEQYLRDLNLEVNKITPQLLQQQWFAHKGAQMLQQIRQQGQIPGSAPAAAPPSPVSAPPRASGRVSRVQDPSSLEEWGDLLPWN